MALRFRLTVTCRLRRTGLLAAVDRRYLGRNHETQVPWSGRERERGAIAERADAFHGAHEQQYGFASAVETVQVASVKARATGAPAGPSVPRLEPGPDAAPTGERGAVHAFLNTREVGV